jgi:hypothetical protein
MNLLLQGFLLGLANGVSCLATCAPVLLPFVVGEGLSVRRSVFPIFQFLCGRLAGYLLFAVFAWEAGARIRAGAHGGLVFGSVYALIALILIVYGFSSPNGACAGRGIRPRLMAALRRHPAVLPGAMGLLTGLSLCPPFVAALAGAVGEVSLTSSLLFFLAFFSATSLYLIPFPFAGMLGRTPAVRMTGRLAAGVMGCYFLYRGLVLIRGGMQL